MPRASGRMHLLYFPDLLFTDTAHMGQAFFALGALALHVVVGLLAHLRYVDVHLAGSKVLGVFSPRWQVWRDG